MKTGLEILVSRSVPALSAALVTFGVSEGHAEPIVIGAIALAYAIVEAVGRWRARKAGE